MTTTTTHPARLAASHRHHATPHHRDLHQEPGKQHHGPLTLRPAPTSGNSNTTSADATQARNPCSEPEWLRALMPKVVRRPHACLCADRYARS